MEETELSWKSHGYFLPCNQEIAQQGQEQEATDPIHNVQCFVTLLYLIYQQITISHISQENKQQDLHVSIIVIACIQTPHLWNAYILSSGPQKHPTQRYACTSERRRPGNSASFCTISDS